MPIYASDKTETGNDVLDAQMTFLTNLTILIEVSGYMLICSVQHYAD